MIGAARELFGERGYAAVTITAVAARARLPRSTVYRRYPSATALRYAALVLGTDPAPVPDSGDARADLQRHIATNATAFTDPARLALLRSVMADAFTDDVGRELLATRFIRPRLAQIVALIERARRQGAIPAGTDADVAAMAITGVLVYRGLVLDDPIDEDLLAAILELVAPAVSPD